MYLSYPLSYPIALLLDRVLGHDEGVTYKKKELKTFVSLHRHLGAENLMDDEVTIISAVLELSEKNISDIMVPIDDIYSLSSEQVLDEETVKEVRLIKRIKKRPRTDGPHIFRSLDKAIPVCPSMRSRINRISLGCCSLKM